MTSPLRALFLVGCILLTACNDVVTIDDVITQSTAIRDDRIIGDWREVDGTDRIKVTRGQTNDYTVFYMDKTDTAKFSARLGRLGTMQIIDVYPDSAEWRKDEEKGIPVHLLYAIDITADSVAIRGLKPDSALAWIVSRKIRVPYTKVVSGDLVLHGDAAGVRAALTQILQQPRVLEDRSWFRRER